MTHTPACHDARTGRCATSGSKTPDWPLMRDLTVTEQQAILDCPDQAHDAARRMLKSGPIQPPVIAIR